MSVENFAENYQTAFPKILRKAVLSSIFLASLALGAYGLYSWQREEQEIRENLTILSSFLASASQSFFDNLGNGLVSLGQSLRKSDLLGNPEEVRDELLSFQTRYPEVRAMVVFAPDGRMLLNTAVAARQPLPDFRTDPPYIQQLKQDCRRQTALRDWRPGIRQGIKTLAFCATACGERR